MADITLLDGGLGQELVKRAGDKPTALWSTQAMKDHPGLLRDLHRDYFAAGATIATTNTYAIHRDRLIHAGIEPDREILINAALSEAQSARAEAGQGRLAGSIGPLGASYRPDIHPDLATSVPLYRELVDALVPHVDLLIFETVSSLAQLEASLGAAEGVDMPVWLAVSVDDEDGTKLRSGEPVLEAAACLKGRADAALANCSAPEVMPDAIKALATSGLPTGAYANGFTQITKDFLKDNPTVDALSARRDMGPEAYADHVMAWVEAGATIVGGCCEVGPGHIAEMARRLGDAGHRIV